MAGNGPLRRRLAAGLIAFGPVAGAAGAARGQDAAAAEADLLASATLAGRDNSLYAVAAGPDAEPALFQPFDLSAHQLLTATLQFDRQKLVFSPGKLFETYRPILSDAKLHASQSRGITTLGIGTSYDGSVPRGDRAFRIAREVVRDLLLRQPETFTRDPAEELEAYVERVWSPIVEEFHERLARHLVIATVGANWQLFEVLGGTDVDADADERIDNAFRLKAWDVGGSISYGLHPRAKLHGAYHYTRRRASAEEGSELVAHHGGSLSGTVRVAELDSDYRESDAYRKSLFVPSIVLGLGVEGERCEGEAAECDDAIRSRWVFTPFVDFLLAQTNQFRVGFPVERRRGFDDESSVELRPVFQYGIQLASP